MKRLSTLRFAGFSAIVSTAGHAATNTDYKGRCVFSVREQAWHLDWRPGRTSSMERLAAAGVRGINYYSQLISDMRKLISTATLPLRQRARGTDRSRAKAQHAPQGNRANLAQVARLRLQVCASRCSRTRRAWVSPAARSNAVRRSAGSPQSPSKCARVTQ